MKKPLLLIPLIVFLLAGCWRQPAPPVEVSLPTPEIDQPTSETLPTATVDEVDEPPPTRTVAPDQPVVTPGGGVSLPAIFDTTWGDRSVYEAGLIESERGVLQAMASAPVYHVDLTINPDMINLSGSQEVLVTNQEDVPLDELYFWLYANLLDGRLILSRVTVDGQTVALPARVSELLRIDLSETLQPGESVVVAMSYEIKVPVDPDNNYGVFVSRNDVLALAHFAPQLAVFDDAGWDIELPSENADVVYADVGFYRVRVTAPEGLVLVATGIEISRSQEGGNNIVEYAAGPVRDFYLAGSDTYESISQMVGETLVVAYYSAEQAAEAETALDVAGESMVIMNEVVGAYPFVEFEVAPTPNLALGVEYPGVVVINGRVYDPVDRYYSYLESTVAHEVGHQYFFGVVGNDQPDEPWIDESLTQYITWRYFLERYGVGGADQFEDSFYRRWDSTERAEKPIGLSAADYSDQEYSAIIYGRGPLFFLALQDEMGSEAFDRFLHDYYLKFKWGLVTTAQLAETAESACRCSLADIFDAWITP